MIVQTINRDRLGRVSGPTHTGLVCDSCGWESDEDFTTAGDAVAFINGDQAAARNFGPGRRWKWVDGLLYCPECLTDKAA